MSNSQLKERQGFLFAEPSIAETGVWCELNPSIDPAEWASMCRHIGNMSHNEFKAVKKKVLPNPDSLRERIRRVFDFKQCNWVNVPVLSIGPSGIGGEYQREG